MKDVVESYENYKEEHRLTTNKARRIEFITSVRAIDEVITPNAKILDCGAGTGQYSLYYAKRGFDVTALDITPRHVDIMRREISENNIDMKAILGNATDLSEFEDNTFDVVMCMGPYYHLPDVGLRMKCLDECLRVLKNRGLLVLAYISRYFVFNYVALSNKEFLTSELSRKLMETGELRSSDPDCFWTDCYFSTPNEVEKDMANRNMEVIDHLAVDGLAPILREKVDNLTEEEYKVWCDSHYLMCREPSILGASNHGLMITRKE